MKKIELIKGLKTWDTEMVVVFNQETGQYFEIQNIARGLGKGIILTIGEAKNESIR